VGLPVWAKVVVEEDGVVDV